MAQNRPPSPMSGDVAMPAIPPNNAKRPRKRPSKRFLWREDQHLRFVAAIFDRALQWQRRRFINLQRFEIFMTVGLKNATPKALLPLMHKSDPDAELTTEHLKSHLQKYRLNYERSRREFKELCEREAKRSRKRQRRRDRHQLRGNSAYMFQVKPQATEGEEHASNASTAMEEATPFAVQYPGDCMALQEPDSEVPAMPELTDSQWRTFSMLMSAPPPDFGALSIQTPQDGRFIEPRVQEELRLQMHQAMQAQMNFHRQMLTRKGELAHDLRRQNWEARSSGNVNYYAQEQLVWAGTQQTHQQQSEALRLQQQQMDRHRPPQQQPPTAAREEPLPNISQPSIVSAQTEELPDTKSDAVDGDLSRWDPFNVGLESDDLFDFLKA